MPHLPFSATVIASALAGALSASLLLATLTNEPAAVLLTPERASTETGTTFQVTVKVSSTIPVNVFKGVVSFPPHVLSVERIDYNTSIADLWAEAPWYENGDGTISFIGGTTKPGGFTGSGALLTITFRGTAAGEAPVALKDVRVLQHDGLGSDAAVAAPIDALFTVTSDALEADTVIAKETALGPTLAILPPGRSPDLNGDGLANIGDVQTFMRYMASQNVRADLNGDGVVTVRDLSIILRE